MKAVQRELAERFRQPRQLFHARGRVRQIPEKDLRQLAGKMTGQAGSYRRPRRINMKRTSALPADNLSPLGAAVLVSDAAETATDERNLVVLRGVASENGI